ncbi:putative sulfate exporter family transporter [Virgibacillus doumboii]|uniref:putative sulfate exporter family transporter n=1 Tax=Virgibacillus doumboii TaxID=2697503 RepID=UPI0013DEFBA2|nr:putative sulfate exporter family transporter [Virgibacillus doumboii]
MEEALRKNLTKKKMMSSYVKIMKLLPGLTMVSMVAYISLLIGNNIPLLRSTVVAIVLGMLLRNFMSIPDTFEEGIQYSAKKLLKLAIILLGVNLNLWQLLVISGQSLIGIVLVDGFGILFTLYISRIMNLSGNIPLLIGVGTAICGATAIATISPK